MSEAGAIEVSIIDGSGAEVARLALPALFSRPVNDTLMHDQVLAQLAGRRSGTATTKTRGNVRGGGAKPWAQKGTGRARAGSNRSPLWRGGGTTFGPQPRSYGYRLPKKARRGALVSALAQKVRDGQLRVVERFELEAPKTRLMREFLDRLGIAVSVLIVTVGAESPLVLAARNLPRVTTTTVPGLNVYDILRHEILLLEREVLGQIEEALPS